MALYAISDLHLSFGANKPMDVFGWKDYQSRLAENWNQTVCEEDMVLIPGDVSWATYLEETEADFRFLSQLPGKKVILKGNHDYWWTTYKKLNQFVEEKGFSQFYFLHNNSFFYENFAICGTRGWGNNGDYVEDTRIWNRELQRLLLSLDSAKGSDNIICCLHYPPIDLKGRLSEEYMELFSRYRVKQVCYGHLHGQAHRNALPNEIDGIRFSLVACDFLDFMPQKLLD